MKAVVFRGIGNIALEEVADPTIKDQREVIVKLTRSAICGTDLHIVRGSMPGMVGQHLFRRGTILGHEGVGVVEEVGNGVNDFKVGDRVIVPSTIGCGYCDFCIRKIYSQCDNAGRWGPHWGTTFFGGPITTGPLDGMQAEKVRVPYADANLVKIPDSLSDDQCILLSDILPTSYMAVELADVKPEDTVAVFGCGPVGQLAILYLKKMGVGSVFAIDRVPSRLVMAQKQGAYAINFDVVDVAKELRKLTDDKGPSRIIDAVGVDAEQPHETGINYFKNFFKRRAFIKEVKKVAPHGKLHGRQWVCGNGPSQVLRWAVEAVEKAGTISIIGVYPPTMDIFPIGQAMGKNLTFRMGNCNHRAYLPMLLTSVEKGEIDLLPFITQKLPLDEAINAYKHFDKREDNWIKVVLLV